MKYKTITNRLLIASLFLVFITSCHNYYKATGIKKNSSADKASSVDSLKLQNRYFVLRNGSAEFHMKDITLSADQKTLECTLEELSPDHQLHLVKGHKGRMQYKKHKIEDLGVTNEVHLYIPQDATAVPGSYSLLLDNVEKIEVLQHGFERERRTVMLLVLSAIP